MKHSSKFLTIALLLALMILSTVQLRTLASPLNQDEAPTDVSPSDASIQVDPELAAVFAANEEAGYLIYFREKADLSAAYDMDWESRGWYVMKTLQNAANQSQADVRGYLTGQGVKYQSFWIDNVIAVESSNKATFQGLMAFNEIESVISRRTMQVIEPVREKEVEPNAITAVEPNIAHVLAPDVWADGIRGEGMVVANVDTGVRASHQALVRQYRGTTTGSNDYNWLGAAGGSATPVDDHGHGTHTMGTIVGEDAALTNQIGVAPGAQWIACDACEGTGCPDTALLTCAQWIAAPYPVGNPGNANPAMRPNVVNNSWGDCGRSYNNWYQGSVDAWHAAGVYPVFSNGNASNCLYSSPPGLNTVGNPARYGNVTGVGSSGESNGAYATHSNWGPTDNPDTVNPQPGWANLKPQVIAPGVSIRSSVPDSDSAYEDGWTGTSMSAPHVTGLVALMWQAGSCLVSDYAATETIIEETATPISYNDGSGARWPNYATGWGEINVAAAVEQALTICGPSGTLAGTVTEDGTGTPLADVNIVATLNITTTKTKTTDETGYYAISYAPAGFYTVTASTFGYLPATVTNVEVVSGTTTVQDFVLTPAPSYTVDGTVTDVNTGWPLYAKITVAGVPSSPYWTDPETGYYSITLPEGTAYDFTVEAFVGGYVAEDRTIGPVNNNITEDFSLEVDALICAAPGYAIAGGLVETFDSVSAPAIPAGWTVVDVSGTTGNWATNVGTRYPSGYAAHSTPNVAYFNSFSVSSGGSTRLHRQSGLDMTSVASNMLSFWMFRDDGYPSSNDYIQVQVSTNGGALWTAVGPQFSRYSSTGDYWEEKTVDLSAYSSETNLMLGFLAVSAYGNDMHIDDVVLGNAPACNQPVSGGLVIGQVTDSNTGGSLTGASVSNAGGYQATTVVTPDPDVDDSFYVLYSPAGSQLFTAAYPLHADGVTTVNVANYATTVQNFALGAGSLEANPTALTTSVQLGATDSLTFDLNNVGDGAASFEILERPIAAPVLMAGEDVLVVASDTTAAASMQAALTDAGYTSLSVADAAFQAYSIPQLLAYKAVFYAGLTSADSRTLLTQYLDAGGSLYISDNDLGYSSGSTELYQTYLQATYLGDNGGDNLNGEGIMAGLDLNIIADPYPDYFVVGAQGQRIYYYAGGNNAGGVAVNRNGYLAIYTAFDFDDMAVNSDEVALVQRIMDYLVPDVTWLAVTPISGTIPALGTTPITVNFDAGATEVTQPGSYLARLVVNNDTPYGRLTIPVTMTVDCPTCGTLAGEITDDFTGDPLAASIQITSTGGFDYTIDGSAYSIDLPPDTYYLSVTAPNYLPETATAVVTQGVTTTTDFALTPAFAALVYDPAAIEEYMEIGDVVSNTVTVTNTGTIDLDFNVNIGGFGGPTVQLRPVGISIPRFEGTLPASATPPTTARAPQAPDKVTNGEAYPMAPLGEMAYALDVYPGLNLVMFPDADAPGAWTVVAPVPQFHPAGDFLGSDFSTLYAIDSDTNQFVSIDTTSGARTVIGTAVGNGSWSGMTGAVDGTLYAASSNCGTDSTLYTINPNTGATTMVGPIGAGTCIIDIAINASGEMYGVDIVSDSLYQINPATGAGTLVGVLGVNANYAQGLDFEQVSGILYWAAYTTSGEMRVIDTTTGASALVGAFPGGAEVDALAFATSAGGTGGWAYPVPNSGTVPAGSSVTFELVFDATSLLQVGTYTADLSFSGNFNNVVPSMPLTMHLSCPTCGILDGSITDADTGDPLAADIHVTGPDGFDVTLSGDSYQLAVPDGDYDFTVSAAGYFSQTATVAATSGVTVTKDFALRLAQPNISVHPESFDVTVALGDTASYPLDLINEGALGTNFTLSESPASLNIITRQPAAAAVDAKYAPVTAGLSTPLRPLSPQDILLTEGFEGGVIPPADWDAQVANAAYTWKIMTVGTPYSGSVAADVVYDPSLAAQNEWLISPEMMLTEGTLSFWSLGSVYWCRDTFDNCDLNVWLVVGATAGDADDILVGTADGDWSGNFIWAQSSFDLTPYLPSGPVRIGFQYVGSDGAQVGLDEIVLDGTEGSLDVPWLSTDPITGTIAADDTEIVDVIFDTTVLTQTGVYNAVLKVLTSDPTNPTINVPITLTVEAPEAAITLDVTVSTDNECGTADTLAVAPGSVVYYCYTVSNTGNVMLPSHTITDTVFGHVSTFVYNLQPGASESVIYTQTITADTTSTARWVASHAGLDVSAMAEDTVTVNLTMRYIFLPVIMKP